MTIYSRPGCHLCEDLKEYVVAYQREMGFVLEERNIDEDAQELARFANLIPVLDIEGGPLFYPPHDWDMVGAALEAAGRQPS